MGKSGTPPSGLVETDDFLDFTLDGEEEKGDGKPISKGATDAAALGHGTRGGSAPDVAVEEEEEELEWLTNEDDFPTVESVFPILSNNPLLLSYHQESPASVLENTNANSSSGSAVAVPTYSPLRPQRNVRERKRKVDTDAYYPPLSPLDPASSRRRTAKKMCSHCKTDKTPQWREGPMGPKTLCNACGVRFKSGDLLPEYRPKSSPTFSSALHSNSRREVDEMRKKKQGALGGDT